MHLETMSDNVVTAPTGTLQSGIDVLPRPILFAKNVYHDVLIATPANEFEPDGTVQS